MDAEGRKGALVCALTAMAMTCGPNGEATICRSLVDAEERYGAGVREMVTAIRAQMPDPSKPLLHTLKDLQAMSREQVGQVLVAARDAARVTAG